MCSDKNPVDYIPQEAIDGNHHHIWCNLDFRKPVTECRQCLSLYKNYPYGNSEEDMLEKYFPGVIKR